MDIIHKSQLCQGYLQVDRTKCAGCQICMLICSLVHEGECNTQLSRIQVMQNTYKPWPDCIQIKQCRQCPSPACVEACPTGAAFIDTAHGNVRSIDETKCIGCKACLEACPHDQSGIIWNTEKQIVMKCDLCANAKFLGEPGGPGGMQGCVSMCPQNAIKYRSAVAKAVPGQEIK
jgi:protein NrfC